MAASGLDVMTREEEDNTLEAQFFGFNPRLFCEDVYNAADDLVADGMDAFEEELMRQVNGSGTRKVIDSALAAEIKEGADMLTEVLRECHAVPGDQLEVYALKNIFSVPHSDAFKEHVRRARAAASTGGADDSSGVTRVYTADEEEGADARIQALEADLLHERQRGRALQHVHALYARRVPEAEDADEALTELHAAFRRAYTGEGAAADGTPMSDAVAAFMAKAARVKDLVDRLAAASPLPAVPPVTVVSRGVTQPTAAKAAPTAVHATDLLAEYERDRAALTRGQ